MKSFVDFNKEVLEEATNYLKLANNLLKDSKRKDITPVQSAHAIKMRKRALEASKMDPVSAHKHYSGVNETVTMTDTIDEKLIGKQKKLDVNKNGKLDAEDFKKLRKEEAKCKEDKELDEAKCKEDAPFEGGVPSKGSVKDKSGAVHTPMSRARHAAKEALKKYSKDKLPEEVELDEWKVESDWKRSDPEDKRSGQEKAKALAAKAATPSKLKPKKAFEEVELDEEINIFCEEMISHSDFHDKIAMHKKAGNNVVDYEHSEKKAHITTIDKEGMKRKVVYTPKGVSMQNMGQHQGEDKDEKGEKIKKSDTTGEKRGRGRPAGSKSGANLANAPAKREFRGVGTHSLNISSNRSMREEVDLDEAEMTPEMKAKREKIVKGMKKSYSSFVSKYGDKAKNVMYATATKMAMKEETETE